jgi:glycosyltransferase involved in cell wall biosynthesis
MVDARITANRPRSLSDGLSGQYDQEIRRLGSQIIPCPHPQRPWVYSPSFKHLLHQHGPYDIVHSHVHHFSGYVLRLAQQVGVPVRIAHSHLDVAAQETEVGYLRRLYLNLMRVWITKYATAGLGCSHEAAADLFGADWESDPRWQILYCGIDLAPFQEIIDAADVRAELSIPADALVIGHVGRLAHQKNHQFLIEIAAIVAERHPNLYLLLVGDGPLRSGIEHQAAQLGLRHRVIFTGVRSDVSRLMAAMDVFVMPSFHEGLPVAAIEAQAAGLPLVLSDVISKEVEVVKPMVQRVSLSQPASVWADIVLATPRASTRLNRAEQQSSLANSAFNITNSVQALKKVYVNV